MKKNLLVNSEILRPIIESDLESAPTALNALKDFRCDKEIISTSSTALEWNRTQWDESNSWLKTRETILGRAKSPSVALILQKAFVLLINLTFGGGKGIKALIDDDLRAIEKKKLN